MNENLNLAKLLKDVPEGTEFYCTNYGDVRFCGVYKEEYYPIAFVDEYGMKTMITSRGHEHGDYPGAECTFFPSKEQRDWKVWAKQKGINYSTGEPVESEEHEFKPFDKVLVRDEDGYWSCDLFVGFEDSSYFPFVCISGRWLECIPYEGNEHLLWTNKDINSHD